MDIVLILTKKFEKGVFPYIDEANTKINIEELIENKNNRKSIAMFKLINANNLENLFEGNFYPIVNAKDGYYTIKDDNGNNCTIRANRGKEIQVFTEPA